MESMPVLCDVVVVGAGLAGAAVANELAEDGLQVVVLESREQVGGTSGVGLDEGWALLGMPGLYVDLVEQLEEARAQEAWALTRQNLTFLRERAEMLGVANAVVGSLRPTASSAVAERVQRSVELLQGAGFDVTLEDATELGFLVGLQTKDDLRFAESTLIKALLDHPAITVQTGTEVEAVEGGASGVDIWAKRLYVRSGVAVLTAGAHVVRLCDYLVSRVATIPLNTVTCSAPAARTMPLVLEDGQVLVDGRGARWQIAAWSPDKEVTPETLIAQTGARLCPEARVLGRSSIWVAHSVDALPLVGPIPDVPGVFALAALGPWGSSWAFVGAKKLLAAVRQGKNADLLDMGRLGLVKK